MNPAPAAGKDPDDHGLECARCGCRHFYTREVRPTWGKKIRRRRECRNCGAMKTTYEQDSSSSSRC